MGWFMKYIPIEPKCNPFSGVDLPFYGSKSSKIWVIWVLGIFYQQTIPDSVFVWPIYIHLGNFGGKFVGVHYTMQGVKHLGMKFLVHSQCSCFRCPTCRFNYSGRMENIYYTMGTHNLHF